MQKLTCEVCGSNDLQKTDDGFFQCQYCGCKYTLEQAKALLGTVETTIGDAELNRRVENAKTQMKIGARESANKTIESIIFDFPKSPQGYLLYFENYFELLLWHSANAENYKDYKDYKLSSFDKSRFDSLYKLSNDSSEITNEELDSFFDSYFKKIYNGLVNGELSEYVLSLGNNAPQSLAKKAYEIGIRNAELLAQNCVGIFNIKEYEKSKFGTKSSSVLAYCSDKALIKRLNHGECWETWKKIEFCLGREWYETYFPIKPLILNEDNINEIVKVAKITTKHFVIDNSICLCGSKTRKTIFGNSYKCTNECCLAEYKLSDLM